MLKPLIKIILVLLLANATSTFAQENYLQRYVSRGIGINYSRVNFLTDIRFYEARHLADTLNVEVSTAADLQSLIDLKLHLKIFGVSVKADSAHIAEVMDGLKTFPQLKFIMFNEAPIFARNTKPLLLPENIKDLQQLEGVYFSFTGINIPDALIKLSTLKNLQAIAFNAITNTPITKDLVSLKNIRFIKISGSDINKLDLTNIKWEYVDYSGSAPKAGVDATALQKLANVKTLKSLNISYYELGDDLSVFSKFTKLKTLDIWGGKLKPSVQLFEQLGHLKNLNALTVRFYKDSVQTVNGIENLINLQQLNLQGLTSLKTIPKAIYGLKKLKSLTMQGYTFTDVPPDVFNMPELEYLDLSANKLTNLPNSEIYGCKQLKTLKLSYNSVEALPQAITSLENLEIIDAKSNKISSVPGTWQKLQHLKAVNLSVNRIATFPHGMQDINSLIILNLNNNKINNMPDIGGTDYQLKQLDLSGNELTALPEHIGKFIKLEILNISGNRLGSLPISLGDCEKLKTLDAHSESRTTSYDSNKPERERYGITKVDSTKYNHIAALPPGLKNTPQLEELMLDGNRGIDAGSIFDVLLSMPRKYLRVNLSGNGITSLPATDKWANPAFEELNLSNNKLTTLPVQFATMKKFAHLSLYKNPLPVDPALISNELNTKGDMKILYNELGITLPDYTISNSDYAMALAKRVSDYFNKNQWQKAISYADRAIAIDSVAYDKQIRWDEIGTCRFKLKDYAGAIKDFERYMVQDVKSNIRIINFAEPVGKYKAEAHLALNQLDKAAQTHEYFGKTYGISGSLQRAALIYKEIGREDKYRQLTDTVLLNHKLKLEAYAKQKHIDVGSILDYAEVLIIAEKQEEAINLINAQDAKLFAGRYMSIKNYLLATANFLTTPNQYQDIKKLLIADIEATGKISSWDFDMFNYWVNQTVKDPIKKSQIMALQNLSK